MANIFYYIGDSLPNLKGTINYTGSPNLTDATVKITAIGKKGFKGVDGQDCSVTIDNAAKTVEWSYNTSSGDFEETGKYEVYLKTTLASGDVLTTVLSDKVISKEGTSKGVVRAETPQEENSFTFVSGDNFTFVSGDDFTLLEAA